MVWLLAVVTGREWNSLGTAHPGRASSGLHIAVPHSVPLNCRLFTSRVDGRLPSLPPFLPQPPSLHVESSLAPKRSRSIFSSLSALWNHSISQCEYLVCAASLYITFPSVLFLYFESCPLFHSEPTSSVSSFSRPFCGALVIQISIFVI